MTKMRVNSTSRVGGSAGPLRRAALSALLGLLAIAGLAAPTSASAAVEWNPDTTWAPTEMVPGERAGILTYFANSGSTEATSWPSIKFDLPAGLTFAETDTINAWSCTGTTSVECTNAFGPFLPIPAFGYSRAPAGIVVNVDPLAPEGPATVSVTAEGAGAATPTTEDVTIFIADQPTAFGPIPGSLAAGAFDEVGNPDARAGAHPFEAKTTFAMRTKFNDPLFPIRAPEAAYIEMVEPAEPLRDVAVDLPPGFIGNPRAASVCENVDALSHRLCPVDSQVGVAVYDQHALIEDRMSAVYNMTRDIDKPARFAFWTPGGAVTLTARLRSDGDWGLSIDTKSVSEANPIYDTTVSLWGVPADSAHDESRCAMPNEITETCVGVTSLGEPGQGKPAGTYDPHSATGPRKPFLSNPTSCSGEAEDVSLHVNSWEGPSSHEADGDPDLSDPRWVSQSTTVPPIVECENLEFEPDLIVQPTTNRAASPTGLHVELSVPQNEDPDGLATAHLKDTTVVLPEGMTVNPSSADGLGACTSAQIGLTSKSPLGFDRAEPACPLSSRIGTVEVDTPLLDVPLTGSVYLAKQGDNPYDSLLAIYIVLKGPGLIAKLAGHVEADPVSGRLTTTVVDNPQLPFNLLTLDLKSGPRAPLMTPGCGTHAAEGQLTSWAAPGTDVDLSDSFQITQGPNGAPCPNGSLNAQMSAGSLNPIAGDRSPFVLDLTREDGSGQFRSLDISTPPGLSAVLKGVPYCPDASLAAAAAKRGGEEIASPSCPTGSQVGTATVGAGAGPTPYYTSGKIYLAGPYKGAPLSFATVVPAVAGPFDLGTVVVRSAIEIDRRTAQVTVHTDPLPTILQGIVLDVRDIRVAVDRPQFTLNPTSCDPMAVGARVSSPTGESTALSSRFQLGECGRLGLKPKLTLRLRGGIKRGKNPALTAVLEPRSGDANLSSVSVALPHSEFLDQEHIRTVCTRVQFAADACPAGAIYGQATVFTPLLDYPLTGPVYLRSSDNKLPDLVPDLRGPAYQPLKLEAAGRTDSIRGGIRNTFDFVPDAPFTKFVLKMQGGKKGLLENSRNICGTTYRATVKYGAHNGLRAEARPALKAKCPKAKKRKRSKR